jgi:hypothetical protein
MTRILAAPHREDPRTCIFCAITTYMDEVCLICICIRCRYSMMLEDGIIKHMFVEKAPSDMELSSGDNMLKVTACAYAAERVCPACSACHDRVCPACSACHDRVCPACSACHDLPRFPLHVGMYVLLACTYTHHMNAAGIKQASMLPSQVVVLTSSRRP